MPGSRKGRKNFSVTQLNLIKRLYRTTPAKQIALKLQCSPWTVYKVAERLGLVRDLKARPFYQFYNGRKKFRKRADGCWIWIASKTEDGYGICHGEDTLLAHRQMYILHNGKVPPGKVLDHRCRNPACVNPDHLEPVTQKVNVWRGNTAKLSLEDAKAILRAKETDLPLLAKEFGTNIKNINRIRRGEIWRDAMTTPE